MTIGWPSTWQALKPSETGLLPQRVSLAQRSSWADEAQLASPRLYRVDRVEVAAMLASLVRRPGFEVQGKQAVLMALDLSPT